MPWSAPAVESPERVLNIGSGRGTSLNELGRLMGEVIGEQPAVEYLSARALDVPVSVLDIGRAHRAGLEPEDRARRGHSPHLGLDLHALGEQGGVLESRESPIRGRWDEPARHVYRADLPRRV